MATKTHHYDVHVNWTGNTGSGTKTYAGYERAHEITALEKPSIAGSSDPAFKGDKQRWNPEELLVASISACHKLWYLGLCAQAGIVVTAYEDTACGTMAEEPGGAGQFTSVVLKPRVTILAECDEAKALVMHHKAHEMCFIARSVNFPVLCEPLILKEKLPV